MITRSFAEAIIECYAYEHRRRRIDLTQCTICGERGTIFTTQTYPVHDLDLLGTITSTNRVRRFPTDREWELDRC